MILESLDTFVQIAKSKEGKKIAVAAAEDLPVLQAISEARKQNIAEPILFGDKEKIQKIADEISFDLNGIDIIDEKSPVVSAQKAVKTVHDGGAHILMKGLVGTADYLRAVLSKDYGLRTGSLFSHIGFFETNYYHKLIAVTDAAQNIEPDLNDKIGIIKNAVGMYHQLGITDPKVALVAAVESVNPKMPVTLDAAAITMMNRRGQLKGCTIDGPLAFDNAVSKEAAEHKGIVSDVAGDADLIFCPNIEVGNVLYKSLTYFGGATVAAIILGASVPIVLTSRADSDKTKLMSIALAASC